MKRCRLKLQLLETAAPSGRTIWRRLLRSVAAWLLMYIDLHRWPGT